MPAQRRRAIELFYREHMGGLLRYLRTKLANQAEVEEIVQEAYLRLCHTDAANRVHNMHGFLYRTASNLVVDRYRERRGGAPGVDPEGLQSEPELGTGVSAPEDAAATQQELQALHAAILELPQRCRQVFIMHRLNEMTQHEVAQALGISRQMVEKHLARAIARCREQLRPLRDAGVGAPEQESAP